MTQTTYIDRNGSTWVVTPSVDHYGRGIPAGREFWAHGCGAALDGVIGFYASSLAQVRERLGCSPLTTYKARWDDFRIECENLDYARNALFRSYANEDIGATEDELVERVNRFEDRHAEKPVWLRAEAMQAESYRYADM